MKVNEIFYSIEGEGIRAGIPCVFIRLYGCNLNCSYCDTRYSCENNDYVEMTVEQIVDKVKEFGCPNITVTGGEPLIHKDIRELLMALSIAGCFINVETNGTQKPLDYIEGVFYTMDYKTNASGMTDKMNLQAFLDLDEDDVIKFVVGSEEDLKQAVQFYFENGILAEVFVSPVFGKIEPSAIVEFLKDHMLFGWRVQLQLHKYIWEPQKRGV